MNHNDKFLITSENFNLKLSAKKCRFFQKRVKWCGRTNDSDGYEHDPKNVEAIKSMVFPSTADEFAKPSIVVDGWQVEYWILTMYRNH